MLPHQYDRLSSHQRDSFVSDGQGVLEPEIERHIIEEGDEWVLSGGITAGRFSTAGLRLIAQRCPGPGSLGESASYRENSPLELMADVSMLMLLEHGVRSFCRRMGRPEKAQTIIDAHFGGGDTAIALRDVWSEPMVFPEDEE